MKAVTMSLLYFYQIRKPSAPSCQVVNFDSLLFMMSTECVQNAANAAAKRRELRRRRLLQGSEDRMKKIMGYSLPGNGMNFIFSSRQAL